MVGVVVLLLTVLLLLAPVPMIQVVPALVIVMISLAYLEEDGVLLSIALLIAVALLAIAGVAFGKWSRTPSGLAELGFRAPPQPATLKMQGPRGRWTFRPSGRTFFPSLLPSSRPSLPFF